MPQPSWGLRFFCFPTVPKADCPAAADSFSIAAAIVFCCYNLLNRKLLSTGYTAVKAVTWSKAFSLAAKTSDVTNFQFLTPLLSTAMGFAMLGEIPSAATIIGGLIIVTGIVIFALKGH